MPGVNKEITLVSPCHTHLSHNLTVVSVSSGQGHSSIIESFYIVMFSGDGLVCEAVSGHFI